MKKLNLFLISTLVIFSIIASCKKDDDSNSEAKPPAESYFVQYDSTKYVIDKCVAYYDKSPINGCYSITLHLLPKEVVYNTFMEDLIGVGNGFSFTLLSNGSDSIVCGNYNIDTTNSTYEFWEMNHVAFKKDFDFFMGDGTRIDMEKGNASITSPSNKIYRISGDFTAINGKKVKIYYKGSCSIYMDKY